ncbi:hypothetical protein JW707_00400 [Candidatus Woesearchaeota archaeon]|nr:hypothetical protein [Candidatus Woesearchaeota archaeon]
MLHLSTILKYYKRPEIQEAIVKAAQDKEVAVKFGEKGFGKRPDVLKYPSDVIELAKQGATSFHCSEELWINPLQIGTNLRKQELDSLRKGWDLVLDIDCPNWTLSKIIGWLIIKTLNDHGIKSVSAKFSGNKGFHIGVPFESMPESLRNTKTKDAFPEGPRNIASYIIDYIGKNYTKVTENSVVEFGNKIKIPLKKIEEVIKKSHEELTKKICPECKKEITEKDKKKQNEVICPRCDETIKSEEHLSIFHCPKCHDIIKIESKKSVCSCGFNEIPKKILNFKEIIEVDTILIASRHLYRMPYSLHEKSGLASIPIDPENILKFEKSMAKPENVDPEKFMFLDVSKTMKGEAENLLLKSMHHTETVPENETGNETMRKIDEIHFEKAVPKELFPPCIHNILKGLEDGKKRSVFVLLNFLTHLGWDYEKIEELMREWNKKNPEPLREVVMIGQLRYHKQNKKKVLPPNCSNNNYYKGFGICTPDNLCAKIKNPVNYSIRKARFLQREQKKEIKE